MQIKPTFHRIVVAPISDTQILQIQLASRGSNLQVPEIVQDKVMQGIVVEVGGGRILANGAICAVQIGKGQRIVFNRYSATEVAVDGKRFFLMSEDDVICVLIPDPKADSEPDVPVKRSEK